MKLGFICPPANNSYYRSVIPMRALQRRGHTIVWPTAVGEDVSMSELSTCDLIHCYRRPGRIADVLALSQRGVAITFDNDDDFSVAEVSHVASGLEGVRHNRKTARELLKIARIADLTTTPSEVLAASYRRAGVENVTVIENYLERSMFGFGSASSHAGLVVGWVAALEHRVDLAALPLVTALKRLLEVHQDLRLLTVGLQLPLHSPRYEHIKKVQYLDLLKVIRRIDVGLAPIADIPVNHARSNVKLKEYGAGVTAWLASPVGPYRDLGERQGGLLVADDDWFSAIDALLRSSRLRRRLAKRSLKWAKTQTIDKHVQRWENAFRDAIDRARERM